MNAVIFDWIVLCMSGLVITSMIVQRRAAEKLTIYKWYRLNPSIDAIPSRGQAAGDHA